MFEKYAALRVAYADDPEAIEAIEAEEKRVTELLRQREYAQLPETQELLALCRKDILTARLKLASDRGLSPEARAELWAIVDARLWFVQRVVKDYDTELDQIERGLEAELSRI